jgi:predicted methyltransferase
MEKCNVCNGEGVIIDTKAMWDIDPDGKEFIREYQVQLQCSYCEGTGIISNTYQKILEANSQKGARE